MNIFEIFEAKKKSLKNPADNPCWTGYHPVGTKQKAGRTVPNCVPNTNEGIGPDESDPWEQGWRAGFRQNEFNPYPMGSKEAKQWNNGYEEARSQPNHYDEGVAEGYAGADDTDTVGFSVNSEAAYNAVMQRFGDVIDHDETSGIMYAPARVWPQIEMVAFDADGEGAVRDEDVAEATGDKPFDSMMKTISQGTKKQAATDKKDQKAQSQQQARDAFGGMFGGGNPASNLKIREQGVAEGIADTKQLLQAYAGLYYNSREGYDDDMDHEAYQAAIQREMDQIEQQIAKQYGPAGVKKLQKYGYEQYHGRGSFDDDVVRESGVAEADRNEMDTPEFQAAIAKMKKRHEQDDQNFNLDKARELGKKLAARSAAEPKTKGFDEDSWYGENNAWSDGKGQWSDGRGQWSESIDRDVAEYLSEMKSAGYDIK